MGDRAEHTAGGQSGDRSAPATDRPPRATPRSRRARRGPAPARSGTRPRRAGTAPRDRRRARRRRATSRPGPERPLRAALDPRRRRSVGQQAAQVGPGAASASRTATPRSDDLEVARQLPVGDRVGRTAATPTRGWRRSGRRSRRRTARAPAAEPASRAVASCRVRGRRSTPSTGVAAADGLGRVERRGPARCPTARRPGTRPRPGRGSRRSPAPASRAGSTPALPGITRQATVRLSTPQVGVVGAQNPSTRRL